MSERDDLIRAARDTSAAVDTATLENALVAYREAATQPVFDATDATDAPVTRRHRVVRALAATTLATKIVIGVATAAAVGGIGVAVTETVHHTPSPRPPVTSVAPPSPSPSSTGGSTTSTSPSSTSSTVTASPSATTTTPTPSGSSGQRTSPAPTGSRSTPPESSSGPSRTPSESPAGDGNDQGEDADG